MPSLGTAKLYWGCPVNTTLDIALANHGTSYHTESIDSRHSMNLQGPFLPTLIVTNMRARLWR